MDVRVAAMTSVGDIVYHVHFVIRTTAVLRRKICVPSRAPLEVVVCGVEHASCGK